MSELSTFCFIQEQTSFAEDYKNFGYEIYERGNRFYLIFEGVLQAFDVMNRNGRSYKADNIMNCINTDPCIVDYLKRNHWLGEIDHPAADKIGEELTVTRISTPSLKYSSHYIRKPRLEGNLLKATIQTDSATEHGMNMAIKIVDGKIIPGFSVRVFGELKMINGKPVVFVKKLITYDWVGFNSHPEALGLLNQPMMESTNVQKSDRCIFITELARMAASSSREVELICESFGLNITDVSGLTEDGSSIIIKGNGNTIVQPILDKNVQRKTYNSIKSWLK